MKYECENPTPLFETMRNEIYHKDSKDTKNLQ